MTLRTPALLLALAVAAARPALAQDEADRRSAAEIRALFEQFNAAWERRDPTFIDRFYAHDAIRRRPVHCLSGPAWAVLQRRGTDL
ncbi:MAG: hypothetical protein IPK85_21325 [Gemmatimonadetes bacterium]|nr:hypothetical protein [Gemmatimonadota bacterium]